MTNPPLDQAWRLARWLVPPARREFVAALSALEGELAAIPQKVREPTLGLMRVIWWRDAVLALRAGPPPAQPVLRDLAPIAEQADMIAEWAETFDASFLPTDEQAGRLVERQRLAALLLGPAAAALLAWAEHHQNVSPLRLAWQALKQAATNH